MLEGVLSNFAIMGYFLLNSNMTLLLSIIFVIMMHLLNLPNRYFEVAKNSTITIYEIRFFPRNVDTYLKDFLTSWQITRVLNATSNINAMHIRNAIPDTPVEIVAHFAYNTAAQKYASI